MSKMIEHLNPQERAAAVAFARRAAIWVNAAGPVIFDECGVEVSPESRKRVEAAGIALLLDVTLRVDDEGGE